MHVEDRTECNAMNHRRYDLETGVARSIDGAGPSNLHPVNVAQATADNAAAVIGRLVSLLAEKGLLDRDDVQLIVGGGFTVVEG